MTSLIHKTNRDLQKSQRVLAPLSSPSLTVDDGSHGSVGERYKRSTLVEKGNDDCYFSIDSSIFSHKKKSDIFHSEVADVKHQRRKKRNKVLQNIKEENFCDSNFKLRSEDELEKISRKILQNIELDRHRKNVLIAERRLAQKERELSRRKSREHLSEDYIPEEQVSSRNRGRDTIKSQEYDLSRSQLHLAKMKARFAKKSRKHGKRVVFIPNILPEDLQFQSESKEEFNFSDVLSLVKSVLGDISTFTKNMDLRALLALLQFVIVVTRTTDSMIRGISCVNLCIALGIDTTTSFVAGIVTCFVSTAGAKLFAESSSTMEFQSMSDVRSVLDKILHSDLTHAIRMVFIGLTSFLNFPQEQAAKIFALVGTSPLKMSILKLVECVLAVITKITSAAALFWYGKDGNAVPISEILFGATTYDGLRESHAILELYKESTYSGLPVKNQMCQFYYIRQSDTFLITANVYLKNIGRHSPQYKIVQQWVLDVTKWSDAISVAIAGQNRTPPLAIALIGDPGVGKSLTTKLICSRPAVIKQYEYDESQVYSKNPGEEFFEGYNPRQHNVVFFSEVGRINNELAKKQGDPSLDPLLSAVDSNRYNVPMAFEGKGKTPFLAELIVIDTNNPEMNFSVLYSNAAAMRRRLIYIEQYVIPEYRLPNSSQIDPEKVENLADPFSPFRYRMYKMNPVTATVSVKYDIPGGQDVNYLDMIKIVDSMFVMHQMRNSKVNARVLEFIKTIPTTVDVNFVNPPKHPAQREIDGDDEVDEKDGIQDRFDRPVTLPDKFMREGIHKGPIPHPIGKTGSQWYENKKKEVWKEITQRVGEFGIPKGFNWLPSFFGKHVMSFIGLPFDADYADKLILDAAYNNMDDPMLVLMSYGKESLAMMVSDLEGLLSLDRPDFEPSVSPNFEILIKELPMQKAIIDGHKLVDDRKEIENCLFDVVLNFVTVLTKEPNMFVHTKYKRAIRLYVKTAVDYIREITISDTYDRLQDVIKSNYVAESKAQLNTSDVIGPYDEEKVEMQFGTRDVINSCYNLFIFVYVHALSLSYYLQDYFFENLAYYSLCLYMCNIPYTIWCVAMILWICGIVGSWALVPFAVWMYGLYVRRYGPNIILSRIRSRIQSINFMIADVGNSFLSRFGIVPRNNHLANGWYYGYATSALLTCVVLGGTVHLYKRMRKYFTVDNEYQNAQSKFADIEDRTRCESPKRRIKLTNDPVHWNVQTALHPRYLYTQSIESFSSMVRQRTYFLWFSKGDKRVVSHGVGIKSNIVLLNTHFHKDAIRSGSRIWASDIMDEYEKSFEIGTEESTFVYGNSDICMSTCGRSFKNLIQHVAVKPVSSAESLIGGVDVVALMINENHTIGDTKFSELYCYGGYSKKGNCGNLLLTSIGSGCAIIGMHVSGTSDCKYGYSVPLYRGELEILVSKIESRSNFFPYSLPQSGIVESTEDVRINRKSPFSHVYLPCIEYFGTISLAKVKKASRVERNIYSNIVPAVSAIIGIPVTKEFGPPVMMPFVSNDGEYHSPQNNALAHFCKPSVMISFDLYSRTVDMLFPRIISRLKSEGKYRKMSPYKMNYAINGSREDDYLRRINVSTAAGYPLVGKKSDYLILQDDNYTRVPTDEIMNQMYDIVNSYFRGERSNSVFNIALKDEPVSLSKILSCVTRFFYVHPLAHLILCRMYLGPLITLLQESDSFYCMVGINMYNSADQVYEKLKKHPFYIEADAKKFDISVSYVVRFGSFNLVCKLFEDMGYGDQEMIIVRGLLSDLLNPMYLLDGDLFSKSSVPSGHFGTAELNCLIILMIIAAVFMEHQEKGDIPPDVEFFDEVCAAIYGDDQSASVSAVIKDYVNNVTISDMYSRMNMELTASDKCSQLLPFVPLIDATFLKRSIVQFNGGCIAPLDPNSIYKMSSWSLKPDLTTYMDRDASVANSALMEWYLHTLTLDNGREVFDKIKSVYETEYLNRYKVPIKKCFDYDYISSLISPRHFQSGEQIFVSKSKGLSWNRVFTYVSFIFLAFAFVLCPYNSTVWEEDGTRAGICSLSGLNLPSSCECASPVGFRRLHPEDINIDEDSGVSHLVTRHISYRLAESYKLRKYKAQEELEQAEKTLAGFSPPYSGMYPFQVKYTTRYAGDREFREYCDRWLEACSRVDSINSEIAQLSSLIRHIENASMEFQSLEIGNQSSGTIDSSVVVTHDTVTEIGGYDTKEIEYSHSSVKYIKAPSSLDDFFKRPIEVASFAMGINTPYEYAYDVMDLYTSDPAVRSKLRNFAFIRGKLKVRISASGTPFDSGRMMVAAYPWYGTNDTLQVLFSGSSWDRLKLQYMSQSKISTVIDVKENKPTELTLPWISPMPVGRLFNISSGSIPSGTSFNDLKNMWRVIFKDLNVLKSISTSPTSVYVYVYAYMEDVEIGVPTGSQMDIVTQSDERKTGPVEKIASNLYSISHSLEQAPYISLYARASSFVFKGIAGVASLFGWSAPVLTTKPNRVKNDAFQNGCNTIQYDTGKRLTLDPKQELAISTEYVSVLEDELVIADMCARQSYLTTFEWSTETVPRSNFYYIVAHPRLNHGYTGSVNGVKNVMPTPMEWVSQLFDKWHGKIVITLEVVCTAFHRGKLLITYDPNVMQYSTISINTKLNKQYTHIWDIQETQKYSICIDWNHARPWAENLSDVNSYNMLHGSTLVPVGAWFDAVNGYLSIAPLTKLQSPDSNPISINVYVHGEDMMFNRHSYTNIPSNRALDWQSDERVIENIESSCIPINESLGEKGMQAHYYGEQPISLRALMKRFVQWRLADFTPATNLAYHYRGAMYPPNPFGLNVDGTTSDSSRCTFQHIRLGFLAMRGSMRHRLAIITDSPLSLSPTVIFLRDDETTTPTNTFTTSLGAFPYLCGGSILQVMETNAGLEFEIPFYSNNLFLWSGTSDPYYSASTYPLDPSVTRCFEAVFYPSGTPEVFKVADYYATGEDFQLSYFLGAVPYVSSA